ncbi:MAG: D-glycerate dehydrogenase [Thermoplasmata archaeon]|nr:D-glycerate dehydrogenase [Thermoplasmata archaeon]
MKSDGKPIVLITRSLPEEGIKGLREFAHLDIWEGEGPMPRDILLERVRNADGLIPMLSDRVDGHLLDSGPKLRAIANYAVGYDNISLDEATRRSIPVMNTPGVLTDATADIAMSLLLSVSRRVVESDRFVREGRFKVWSPKLLLGKDLRGRTLGIIGAGKIGQAVMERARGFGLNIVYHSRNRNEAVEEKFSARYLSLEDLLRGSDIISLHVPLTEETRHMIGERELSIMKRSAILINTARGPVIDEKALSKALRERRVHGAGLDVYEEEPKVYPGLMDLDNVVLLPHLGSATEGTRIEMAMLASEGVMDVLSGRRPKHCLNPEVLEDG